jgi:hypothetical protein
LAGSSGPEELGLLMDILTQQDGYFRVFIVSHFSPVMLVEKRVLDISPRGRYSSMPEFFTRDWFLAPLWWEPV